MTQSNSQKFKVPTSREILKGAPNAVSDWKHKNPLQKYCYLYGIGKMGMSTIGYTTFQDDQTLTIKSYFAFIYSGITIALMLYTIFYYAIYGEFAKSLPCTCLTIATNISTLAFHVCTHTIQRYRLHSMVDFGGRYIYRNHHDDIEYQQICSRHMDKSMKHFLTKMLMMTIGFTAAVMGPTYAFIFNGIRTTTFDAAVPYAEEKSLVEFSVNSMIQLLNATYGALIYLGMEVAMELFSNIITISPRLIEHKLRKIISDYAENQITPSQLHFAFMDFVKQLSDANDYVKNVSDLLFWRSLLTPILFLYSIGMSIYCQFTLGFVAGYGIAFMSWVQFFYICDLGESMVDNGFVNILNDSDWQLLPLKYQKIIILLINRQQNTPGLSIGPFGADLNRNIFKIITNKIYSFVMFLKNFGN